MLSNDKSISAEPPRKRRRRSSTNDLTPDALVTLIVGSDGKEVSLTISRNLACHHSPVLKAAFNGNFQNSTTKEYRLAHIDEATGRLFVRWLYYGSLGLPKKDKLADNTNSTALEKYLEDNCEILITLWALGDELGIPQLQNKVLETVHHIQHETGGFYAETIIPTYRLTGEESMLRKYIVEYCFYVMNPEVFKEQPGLFCQDFLLDFAIFSATENCKGYECLTLSKFIVVT